MLFVVWVVVVVTVVTGSKASGAVDEIITDAVLLRLALAIVSPAVSGTLPLSAELIVGAEPDAMKRAATGVSGSVLGAQRGPGSGGCMPTLTAAPQ